MHCIELTNFMLFNEAVFFYIELIDCCITEESLKTIKYNIAIML